MVKTIRISHTVRNDLLAKILTSRFNVMQHKLVIYILSMTYDLCRDSIEIHNERAFGKKFGCRNNNVYWESIQQLRDWHVLYKEDNRHWLNLNLDEWTCPMKADTSELRKLIGIDVRRQVFKLF